MSVGGASYCTPCSPIIPQVVPGDAGKVSQSPEQSPYVAPPAGESTDACYCPDPSAPIAVDPSENKGAGSAGNVPAPQGDPGEPDPTPVPVPGSVDPNTGAPVGPTPVDPSGTPSNTDPNGTPAPVDPTGQPAPSQTGAPANTLPDWPQWQQEFAALGVDPANIARIGEQPLTNEQLALVYVTVRRELEASGAGKPIDTKPSSGGWSDAWQQKFAALGLDATQIDRIHQVAIDRGADDATLQQLYDIIAQQVGAGEPGTTPVDSGTGTPGTPGTPGVPGADGAAGWNASWEDKFRKLGMPDSIVALYAQSGAPDAGLQAAFNFAKTRFEQFNKNGWYDKLVAEKVPAEAIWQLILSPKMPTEKEIRAIYDAQHQQNMPGLQRKLQLGVSLIPGGELVQYALGRKLVSGKEIDRSSPMNIAFAAASGLAAFTAFRGLRNLGAGWKAMNALKGGTAEITKVGITMEQLGLHGQAAALNEAAEGAAQILTGKSSKFMSLIPFTKAHQQVVGLGHLESAARAFNGGGAEALLAASPSGSLAVQTLGRSFEDIMRGNMALVGNRNAYLGNLTMPFRGLKQAPMAISADGTTIVANRALRASNGGQTLTALLEASGVKLRNPEWIGVPEIAQRIASIDGGAEHLRGIGQLMAADAAPILGANVSSGLGSVFGRLKPGVAQYYDNLVRNASHPNWYSGLIGGAAEDVARAGGAADDVARAGGAGAVDDAARGAGATDVPAGGNAGTATAADGQLQLPLDFGGAAGAGASGGAMDDLARTVAGPAAGQTEQLIGLKIGNLSTNNGTRRFVLSGDADAMAAARVRIDEYAARGADVKVYVAHDDAGAERLIIQGDKDAVNALKRALRKALDHANSIVPA